MIILKDGFDYAFKAHNATNGGQLTIDASEIGAGNTVKFDAGAETANGYVFMPGAGADTITGGSGIDSLDFTKASAGATVDLTNNAFNDGFGIEPEITAKIFKRGYRVYEVPITYDGRGYDEGKKITWRDGLVALWVLVRHRLG